MITALSLIQMLILITLNDSTLLTYASGCEGYLYILYTFTIVVSAHLTGCAMSGLIADAKTLIDKARVETQV